MSTLAMNSGNKNSTTLEQKYEICKNQTLQLRDKIDALKITENKTILLKQSKAKNIVSPLQDLEFNVIKKFKGHNGKIYAADWSSNNKLLLSGSQDGHLMIWDALTTMKKVTYQLSQSAVWVMTCGFSPNSTLIASGGLDNTASLYKVSIYADNIDKDDIKDNNGNNKRISVINKNRPVIANGAYKRLMHHEGYLSSLQFLSEERLITASGDSTCVLWDVNRTVPLSIYLDHTGDVTSVSINKDQNNPQIFLSGSVDATIKLWDIRLSKCVGEFTNNLNDNDSDVNDICWFPDNYAFASGSDDGILRMYDIRAYKQLNEYFSDNINTTVTSVSFSNSGRILFAGYDDDPFGVAWDVAYSEPVSKLLHNQSVSSLKVSPNGYAILTSSWDKLLRLWIGK